jgi:predicted SAM-dependent methyltransferase
MVPRPWTWVRSVAGCLVRPFRKAARLVAIRVQIRHACPLKVVLGSGPVTLGGWLATDSDVLDVTSLRAWERLFRPDSIDRLMAEHVFEHLSDSDCTTAFQQCLRYLKRGGVLRIAVPDGYRRDRDYVEEVTPPKDGHRQLFTVESLTRLLNRVGFETTPLEYFDAKEEFHCYPWNEADGLIRRSARFDSQERFKRGSLYYTSLIVDARKL